MRAVTSCAITTGGTRLWYSRSFRRTSRCGSAFAISPWRALQWWPSMAEAVASVAATTRIARWVRALRGVAWTRHVVETHTAEQHELRGALDHLRRTQSDMVGEMRAKVDSATLELADAPRQLAAVQQGLRDVAAMQQQFAAGQATVSAALDALS